MKGLRIFFITAFCKLLHCLLKLTGHDGNALPGLIAQKLYHGILSEFAEGIHCICVTGTNGKTTTVQLLSSILRNRFGDGVLDNIIGNLPQSITYEFIHNTDVFGRLRCRYAVIECDEDFMPAICREIRPEVVVVTNVSEDQVSRFPSLDYVAGRIRKGIELSGKPVLCVNADDRLVLDIAGSYDGEHILFGKDTGKNLGISWDGKTFDLTDKGFSYRVNVKGEGSMKIESAIPGEHNVYNAMAALSACKALGLSVTRCASLLKDIQPAECRMQSFEMNGIQMRVSLVKNPVSFKVMADYVSKLDYDLAIVLAQAAELPDDMDLDWIRKTDLTGIRDAGHIKMIFITGKTAGAWYEHFASQGFSTDRIRIVYDTGELLSDIRSLGLTTIWLPCYSESIRLQKYFK